MKFVLLLLLIAAAGAAYVIADPLADDDDAPSASRDAAAPKPPQRPIDTSGLSGSACEKLAELAGLIAEQEPTPTGFLRRLGREAAGIRPGRSIIDLARGGRNLILGRGFRPELDDGTEGQVRHFGGVAYAATLGGASPTRWISENLRDDPADSPDGRLTDEAIAFAGLVRRGELEPGESREWLAAELCSG